MRIAHKSVLAPWVLGVLAASAWAQATDAVPLKNWAAPLSWQPTTEQERVVARERAAKVNGLNPQISPASGTEELGMLVAITPCRLVDTRSNMPQPYGSGTSTPMVWTAGSQTSVPATGLVSGSYPTVGNPCVGLPAAEAYSANITVWPQPAGTILMWLSVCPTGTPTATCSATATVTGYEGGTTGTAAIVSNSAVIPVNASGSFDVYVTNNTWVIIDINGYYAPISDANGDTVLGINALANNTGTDNTAVGIDALQTNTIGLGNTATGASALLANSTGSANTATGASALLSNTTGVANAATGTDALSSNTSGNYNTASGASALLSNTIGGANTAGGAWALSSNTTGSYITATGYWALKSNTTGTNNIGIGASAAANVSGGNSNNIHIGTAGASADSDTIRIGGNTALGDPATQAQFFASGIYGATVTGNAVYVSSGGQLGVQSSSRRYKQDIRDMGDTTETVMGLRPVRFRYKTEGADGSEQYGLIAEEVEEVAPELVGRGLDGQIDSVHYEKVNAILLNQVQAQQRQIEAQKQQIDTQNREFTQRLEAQDRLIRQLGSHLVELERQVKVPNEVQR